MALPLENKLFSKFSSASLLFVHSCSGLMLQGLMDILSCFILTANCFFSCEQQCPWHHISIFTQTNTDEDTERSDSTYYFNIFYYKLFDCSFHQILFACNEQTFSHCTDNRCVLLMWCLTRLTGLNRLSIVIHLSVQEHSQDPIQITLLAFQVTCRLVMDSAFV